MINPSLVSIRHGFVVAIMAISVAFNTLDFNLESDAPAVGLDGTVMAKLGLAFFAGLIGLWCAWRNPIPLGVLFKFPGILLVALGAVLVATSLVAHAPVANACRGAALVYCLYLWFIACALADVGWRPLAIATIVGITINLIGNSFLYLMVPEIGVFFEPFGSGIRFPRMGGLAHPNSVGRSAVVTLLLVFGLFFESKRYRWILAIGIVSLCLFVLAASYSRTAILAGILSTIGLFLPRRFDGRFFAFTFSSIALGCVLLVAFGGLAGESFDELVVASLTKTGDAKELTTATGRTDIWGEALRLIKKRPLTGYGLNSAPELMEQFSSHTHNFYLHAAFSGGIFALILAVGLSAWLLIFGVRNQEPWICGLSTYILVSGLVEDTLLETFPGPSTLWFLALVLWPSIRPKFGSSYNMTQRPGLPTEDPPSKTIPTST